MLEQYWTDPFAFLGMHREGDGLVLPATQPHAAHVFAYSRYGVKIGELTRLDAR